MNNRLFRYLLLVLLCFSIRPATAEVLDINSGLSHNGVTSILEDSRGYLWVGTYDGLNLYNGNNFSVFRNNADTTILRDNRVRSLVEDREGRVWIGFDRGVMIYDYMRNQMLDVKCGVGLFQNDDIIRRLILNSHGDIVAMVESGGVATFSRHGYLRSYKKMAGVGFNDIVECAPNKYLITTDNGLYLFDSQMLEYKIVSGAEGRFFDGVSALPDGRFVVATVSGIATFECVMRDDKLSVSMLDGMQFEGTRYKAIYLDRLGSLWLGSYSDGVTVVDHFGQQDQSVRRISSSQNMRISYFCEGENDRFWIGSFNRGLIQYSLKQSLFKSVVIGDDQDEIYRTGRLFALDNEHVVIKSDKSRYLKHNIITSKTEPLLPRSIDHGALAVAPSANGSLWVVDGFGESNKIFTVKGSAIRSYAVDFGGDAVPHGLPKSMIEDTEGNLWIAYAKSLYRVSIKGLGVIRVEHIDLPNSGGKLINSRSMYIDQRDKSLWVPTSSVGLYHIINPASERDELEIVNYRHQSSDPRSIPSNLVTSVLRAKDNSLWVGTEQGGLCRLVEPEMSFEMVAPLVGAISNNNVKSLLCDNDNRLWIATNAGLSLYDIAESKVVNYGRSDGLPSDAMTYHSASMGGNIMVFGGSDRAFVLDVQSELNRNEIPQFHFGKLRIYSTLVEPGREFGGNKLYDSRLQNGDTIEFEFRQNVFSVEIDDLHYGDHRNHLVRYKLLPQNREWIVRDASQGVIAFNGLQYGDYELVVQVSNAYGEWSPSKMLNIVVHPPLWRTWWAYLIYMLVLIAGVLVVIQVFIKIEGYKHDVEMEALERDNMVEKQRYFSNIAHEIKTPLALIVAPVESLLETFAHDKDVRSKLQRINAQSRKMTHLIDVAQSIQLSDAGLLKLQRSVFDFDQFIGALLEDFMVLAEHDKKSIVVVPPAVPVIIKADLSMVEKICNNLVNNALKYTLAGDTITVSWSAEGDNLVFRVADSGIGIAQSDLPHIFERFYRGTNLSTQTPSGTGIGLSFSMRLARLHGGEIVVESQQGEGSQFIVELPVVSSEQPDTEVVAESADNFIYDDSAQLDTIEKSEYSESLIYIVEDNIEMRMMLERIVGKFYSVQSFANGDAALEAMDKRWPDLVLSDVMMPIMDGYELCERVKSDIRTSHIPVVLLTACASNEEKIKGKELGADLYLVKPFYPKYLITCIENTLSARAKLRDRFKSGLPTTFSDERQTSQDNRFLERFYALITENIATEDLDLDSFARELGVNRTHFYQKIKNLTGQTPFDLLREVRLVRAAALLVEGELTVEQVCVDTGFKSRTHFSKLFKDRFGLSPGKYATSLKQ